MASPGVSERNRRALCLVAGLIGAGVAAEPAAAAQVRVENGSLVFAAAASEQNRLTLRQADEQTVWVQEQGAPLSEGPGCTRAPDPAYLPEIVIATRCSGVARLTVRLGDADDVATFEGVLPTSIAGGDGADYVAGGEGEDTLSGEAGDDALRGGPGPDAVDGGAGNDSVAGDMAPFQEGDWWSEPAHEAEGPDQVSGGEGDDSLVPGRGADAVSGGLGADVVNYSGRTAAVVVVLGGSADAGEPGEGDHLGEDVEGVITGHAADVVTGSAGDDRISTGPGNDRVDGGAGADAVDAGAGDDEVRLADDDSDAGTCGTGRDAAYLDGADAIAACEALRQPAAPSAKPLPAPRVQIARRSRAVVGRVLHAPSAAWCASGVATLERSRRSGVVRQARVRLRRDCRFRIALRTMKGRGAHLRVRVTSTRPPRAVTSRWLR